MKFNNRENKCHIVEGVEVWSSRSVAVVGMIIALMDGEKYVIMGKRGPASPNEIGKWCMPCGYLDYDETCEEAVVRETWEESGFNVNKAVNTYDVLYDHMHFPWKINSIPDSEIQNVSLNYALYFSTESLPKLTIEHNAIDGEVSEIKWINVNDVENYDCAFNHDSSIRVFINSLPGRI
jgi:8-oxo-dGTP pyrophosphatase MutT (NUDIX family)